MSLTHAWVGPGEVERLSEMRLRCYGSKPGDRDSMLKRTQNDRFDAGDALILSDATGDVATATSMSLQVNARGRVLPCQGVAWVGTARSHRRRKVEGRGLASHVMHALLAKARERGQVVSMLAPFRVSFYEHFGYGVVERQNYWTLPLSILPPVEEANFAEAKPADFDAMLACRERQFAQTHGDVRTDARSLRYWLSTLGESGFRMVDWQGDRITSQFSLGTEVEGHNAIAVVHRPYWDSLEALRRLLGMLGTLRDQYSFARITLPADLPVAWWFKERQQPHRRVDHPTPLCHCVTRMQARILDHVAYLSGMRLETPVSGGVTIGIRECDGPMSRVRLEMKAGQIEAKSSTAEPDVTMSDVTWAAIAFGDQRAGVLAAMGLIEVARPEALPVLNAFAEGMAPFCHEYF
ncbi:MAG: GNAT family N-acetyltransferase [Tepidisphaeraceae bacterium]